MSEVADLLRELIEEVKSLKSEMVAQSGVSQEVQKQTAVAQEAKTTKGGGFLPKQAGKFGKFSSAYQSGDVRQLFQAGAQMIPGKTSGFLASSISEVASMFGPRGYNAFNIFEKYDATKVKPFQQVEQLAYEYGRYGIQLDDDKLVEMYNRASQTEERGFSERERVRKLIRTSALSGILEKFGIPGADLVEKGIETVSGSAREFVSSGSQEKTDMVAKKQREMKKAIDRQDKMDDSYN